jgi:hypothetical protein
MFLKTVNILPQYEAKKTDIVKQFYDPVLSCATKYDRVSCYFSSDVLRLYCSGLGSFVNNNGKIRFLFSEELSEEDYLAIKRGYKERLLRTKLGEIDSQIKLLPSSDDISNLGYLVANGIVDIKIGFAYPGILHNKFGLIYDNDDCVYFRGSNNETAASIKANSEGFETTKSWTAQSDELEKMKVAQQEFEDMWNDNFPGVEVCSINQVSLDFLKGQSDGKLHINYDEEYPNSFVLDLSWNGRLIGINQTILPVFQPQMFFFKTRLESHVDKIDGKIVFFKEQTYIEMQKIIDACSKEAERKGVCFCVTERLQAFIRAADSELSKRLNGALAIKNHDASINQQFDSFSQIVNNETSTPLTTDQMWDAFHFAFLRASSDFSVPGTGKTWISYGAFAYLSSKKINLVDKLIVFGPLSSFLAWKTEFANCFGSKRALKVLDLQNPKYSGKDAKYLSLRFDSGDKNLILINYEAAPSLLEAIQGIIDERTMLVFDEAHKIKRTGGTRAEAMLNISKKAVYKLVLTGTPIPNSYRDIWNMLHILYPSEYSSLFGFTLSELDKAGDDQFLQKRINERFYPSFCRITKDDLGVPRPDPDNMIVSMMTPEEQHIFDIVWRVYGAGIFSLFIRLAQASCNPSLVTKGIDINDISAMNESLEFNPEASFGENVDNELLKATAMKPDDLEYINSFVSKHHMTSKYYKGINLVENLVKESKKVVVWGVFIDTLNKINNDLSSNGIRTVLITGTTSQIEREKEIARFTNGDYDVLITNPATLAESISLHHICHDAVYFEYSYNLTHMLQSRDRINRYGLKPSDYTRYYYLVLTSKEGVHDCIDNRTYLRLEEKKNIMENALKKQELFVRSQNQIDDVLYILGKEKS